MNNANMRELERMSAHRRGQARHLRTCRIAYPEHRYRSGRLHDIGLSRRWRIRPWPDAGRRTRRQRNRRVHPEAGARCSHSRRAGSLQRTASCRLAGRLRRGDLLPHDRSPGSRGRTARLAEPWRIDGLPDHRAVVNRWELERRDGRWIIRKRTLLPVDGSDIHQQLLRDGLAGKRDEGS